VHAGGGGGEVLPDVGVGVERVVGVEADQDGGDTGQPVTAEVEGAGVLIDRGDASGKWAPGPSAHSVGGGADGGAGGTGAGRW
jgi:hypothetical protein